MGKRSAMAWLLLVLVMFHAVSTIGYEEEEEGGGGGGERRWFEEREPSAAEEEVVRTEAGRMTIVKSFGRRVHDQNLHIGFITMEPKSLFIPQYLDTNLALFVRRGEVTVGLIYKDELVEKRLKIGDVYTIAAGSAFYLVNTGEGQRLHLVCGIDSSESLEWGSFQSFFIGGGTSVLSGFDRLTMAVAFNVSVSELEELLTQQKSGPIVYLTDSHPPSVWNKIFQLRERERLQHLKKMLSPESEVEEPTWSIRKILNSMFGEQTNKKDKKAASKAPDAYNLYDAKPGFKNNYGWSTAIDHSEYPPLKQFDIGVYIVNLTAGSMLAPHVNPVATEYGVVLRGSGTVQIVFPNGTQALSAEVNEGDVFWVPRYFPFCQVASRTGPFEFFGFTTSSRNNRPQFLVGANSLLQTLRGPEFAASFGVSEERLRKIIDAQNEGTILPPASASPGGEPWKEGEEKEEEEREREREREKEKVVVERGRVGEGIRNLVDKMAMGFD